MKYVYVLARLAVAHKLRILFLSVLCGPNPLIPCTPLKSSGAFPTWPLKSNHGSY